VLNILTATCIETYVLRRKVELSVMVFVGQDSDFKGVFLSVSHYLEILS